MNKHVGGKGTFWKAVRAALGLRPRPDMTPEARLLRAIAAVAERCVAECERSKPLKPLPAMDEHVVVRVNAGWYVCGKCGQAGSERWAILHQFPSDRNVIGEKPEE